MILTAAYLFLMKLDLTASETIALCIHSALLTVYTFCAQNRRIWLLRNIEINNLLRFYIENGSDANTTDTGKTDKIFLNDIKFNEIKKYQKVNGLYSSRLTLLPTYFF